MDNQINLITTRDGSHSLYVPALNEHYHSVHGAIQESMIVFIKNGYDFLKDDEVNILEIGFGTGLNALLTLERATIDKRKVNYTAIEKYPLDKGITGKLNYESFTGNNEAGILNLIHSAPWDIKTGITENFTLTKIRADFTVCEITGIFNLIYFDAFGPDKQPGMWEEHLFRKIESVTRSGGVFVTYSAKGAVKRILRSCGFRVSLVQGPPGKREMIRAVKI